MLRTLLLASAAALFAVTSTTAIASAKHHHFQNAYVTDNGMLVGSSDNNDENDENDEDVVSVAEPVSYATVQSVPSYQTVYQTTYVPVNDTIVTPYGYTPVYNNGYYQGYGYNPQYATYNPYYMGAAYGNGDPLSAAVVNTVLSAAVSGGRVDGRQVLQSLLGAFVASQAQQQYQQQYQQYPQYSQPVYYPEQQRFVQVQSVQVQSVIPMQVVPVYHVRHGEEHRGDHGDHGGGDHGNHGDHDGGDHGH